MNDRRGKFTQIVGLLTTDLAVPHFLITEFKNILRGEIAQISIEFIEMRIGGSQAYLLFKNYFR